MLDVVRHLAALSRAVLIAMGFASLVTLGVVTRRWGFIYTAQLLVVPAVLLMLLVMGDIWV